MRRRRSEDARLMAFRQGRSWSALDAARVNDYLRTSTGGDMTAKDFRTWHATVLAAASLASTDEPGETQASRKRAVRRTMVEVSTYLGNTPAVAKSSYVDPRVVDLYERGVTIGDVAREEFETPEERQAALEQALVRMMEEN
jgi:DNA topoisomerase-1